MSAVITLTTDFGMADGYVAAMKGVALGIDPQARLIDISHSISPQDKAGAAFILGTTCPYFPKGTIHLAVVDPGVGTDRRAIILRTPDADYVAPDNGILSYIVRRYAGEDAGGGMQRLPAGLEAVVITDSRYWRTPVSATFHGRDIFMPVAAHLSLGVTPASFGEPTDSLFLLPSPLPELRPDGSVAGRVLHIDAFGNLVTGIRESDLPGDKLSVVVEVCGKTIHGVSRTYGGGAGLVAIIGSSDYLEIALRDGSAAELLGVKTGEKVEIKADGS